MKRGLSAIEILMGIVFIVAVFFVFYGSRKSSDPGIVVVDLHQVYQDLGRDLTDAQEMRKEQSALEVRRQSLLVNLEESIEAKKKEFGENPTEEQSKLLAAIQQDAMLKVNQEMGKNRASLQKYQTDLITEFRKEVKEVVDVIMKERNVDIVMIADPAVLSVTSSRNITNEVTEAMQLPLQ